MSDPVTPEKATAASPEAAAPAAPNAPAAPKGAPAAAPAPKEAPAAAAPAATAPAAPPAAPEDKSHKVKMKRPTQRACDEKDEKNKVCCGHLKRWYDYPADIEALIGKKAEIYRCEFCQTLYKPDLAEMPHSYTLRY
jgi:hypothetical protein